MKKSELRQIIREKIQRQLKESLDVKDWEIVDDPNMPYVILKFEGGKTLRIVQTYGADGRRTFRFIVNALKTYNTNADSKKFIDSVVDKKRIQIK